MPRERDAVKFKPVNWPSIGWGITRIANKLSWESGHRFPGVYGEPRGGLVLAVALSHHLQIPLLGKPQDGCLWCDDIIDSGATLARARAQHSDMTIAALYVREHHGELTPFYAWQVPENVWIVFPWEARRHAKADFAEYLARQRGLPDHPG